MLNERKSQGIKKEIATATMERERKEVNHVKVETGG